MPRLKESPNEQTRMGYKLSRTLFNYRSHPKAFVSANNLYGRSRFRQSGTPYAPIWKTAEPTSYI